LCVCVSLFADRIMCVCVCRYSRIVSFADHISHVGDPTSLPLHLSISIYR
jgi:hypothetical protein